MTNQPLYHHLFSRGPVLSIRMFVCVLLCLALLFFDKHTHRDNFLHLSLALCLTPFQYTIRTPVAIGDWLGESLQTRTALLTENRHLKTKQTLLASELQRARAIETENKQLRQLLHAATPLPVKVHIANILAIQTNPLSETLTIDKGRFQHVFEGEPVLDAKGVFGQVVQVEPNTARVMLLTDTQSALPVQIERSGFRAIVTGTGNNRPLSLIHVPSGTDIKTGDKIVTSGLGGRFPFGYPVGTVMKVFDNPNAAFLSIDVEPSAHLNRSRTVLLLSKHPKLLTPPASTTKSTKLNTHTTPKQKNASPSPKSKEKEASK